MTEEKKTLSRRTVVKGAAWSVPVIAAAVATPFASASNATGTDVGVTAQCVGNYRLGVIDDLVSGIVIGQTTVKNAVVSLLGILGLTEFQSRDFVITAVEGDIPTGESFTLSYPSGLIDLTLLENTLLAQASVLGAVTVNTSNASFALTAPLTQGNNITLNLANAYIVQAGVGGNVSLTYDGTDSPSTAPGAPNSASLNAVTVDLTVSQVITLIQDAGLGGGLLGGLLAILNPVLSQLGAPITVQLCPGQSLPTAP